VITTFTETLVLAANLYMSEEPAFCICDDALELTHLLRRVDPLRLPFPDWGQIWAEISMPPLLELLYCSTNLHHGTRLCEAYIETLSAGGDGEERGGRRLDWGR
jgi:hypothetical protein